MGDSDLPAVFQGAGGSHALEASVSHTPSMSNFSFPETLNQMGVCRVDRLQRMGSAAEQHRPFIQNW